MKVTAIVLDSVGLGYLPDAPLFGDEGADTLDHTVLKTGVELPHLAALGLGWVPGVHTLPRPEPQGAFGRMREVNPGKDTTTGHWEFVGVYLEKPFRTYPEGFPEELLRAWAEAIGVKGWLLNRPYSGTEAIRDYGETHLKTGFPIVYTSADSVFQVAAHLEVVPLEELYRWCQVAREMLKGEHQVARVIARPFAGEPGNFYRREDLRKDFALEPPRNVLDLLKEGDLEVVGVGKIPDIYAHRGFTREVKIKDNTDGLEKTLALMQEPFSGLLFANLVDFDAKYGHRRNPEGYARALKEVDDFLPRLMEALGPEDHLFLVSDHGNDPTFFGTDHTREYGMLLWVGPGVKGDLGTRESFADLGATWARLFGLTWEGPGKSLV
ncbi:phosphopentomutase [Thermus scotoductus]|uniref:Phosphopentomutase n=1 Tax=Thermus scotoductus TaxID=37636 RepID=A0A430S563_THESC|nr:phosphopentomutase [Thermus scotoductus]RTG92879.1 phosphopentomutase [Thermus scotoductus]RTH06209.1 phosphopentomutase [Thermus scotoductus]RTH08264.1 phosphopentomutase [Thermus scotoductus]RTH08956.1 phosphopentomutase [Thermus scotoductus]RTH15614.1 phosphopentomutase [Thermus scotoductus]